MGIFKGIRKLASQAYRFFYPLSLVEVYKRMGVKIGSNCHFQFDVVIDHSHYWLIEIGDNVTLAPRVHLLAHDASTKLHLNYTRIGKVKIGNNVFVGAGSIVLPGVTIGNNCVIGAGSVVSKSIPENSVAAGNPCKVVNTLDHFLKNRKEEFVLAPKFDESFTLRGNIDRKKMDEMLQAIGNNYGYVV
ncbi:MAG: hypothetical protein KIS94_09745 [Chitinophagales bacterium]|nr:hypothetical protein [Chitinophagales bacterium]